MIDISAEEIVKKQKEYVLSEKMSIFAIIASIFLLAMPLGEIVTSGVIKDDTKTALVIFAVMLAMSVIILIKDVYKIHQLKNFKK